VLDRIDPDPGFGMVTVHLHADDDAETADAMIVPLGSIRRIELRKAPPERVSRFGFSIPPSEGAA
jgi:hypothetical protein